MRLVRLALGLAWGAGRRELLFTLALEALSALGLIAVLLLGRDVVDAIVHGTAVAGPIVLFTGAGVVVAFAQSAVNEQQQLLIELCERHGRSRVLDVATRADLAAFDDAEFHDRLERAQNGLMRAPQIVFSLTTLASALSGLIAAVVTLLALQPLLVPLAVLALIPAALATSRRGEAFYRFAFSQMFSLQASAYR